MKRALRTLLLLAALACLFAPAALGEASVPDGEYAPEEFAFSGGSGRIEITCSKVTVVQGAATAEIVFSSPNYPTVTLEGVQYEGAHTETTSAFELPVPLNRAFVIRAVTTAMSQPHEIEYTLFIRLGATAALPGLTWAGSMDLAYAEGFSIDDYEGGYALIGVKDGARYLVVPEEMPVPEDLDPEIIVLQKPIRNVYLAASSVMALFDRLDALDAVRFSGTEADGWYVESAVEAMRAGDIVFAGKYSEPDYELLVKEDCGLAIESTMILHTPKVQEMLELLGIPVFIDRSSYEPHPLGRTEWIRLYGVLLDREAAADAFFDAQREKVEALADFPAADKKVAFFYITPDGAAVVRGSADYIARMIELGGGAYAFPEMGETESGRASVSITMEDFYAGAVDADYLIYNASIDGAVATLADLRAKSPLLADFKAVREGNVWFTGKNLYQATDIAASLIEDVHRMLNGQEEGMVFLQKLN